jgi:hypothetical protein
MEDKYSTYFILSSVVGEWAWLHCSGKISNYLTTDMFVYRIDNSSDPNIITLCLSLNNHCREQNLPTVTMLTNQLSFHSSLYPMMLHQTLFNSTERTPEAGDMKLPVSLDLFTEFTLLWSSEKWSVGLDVSGRHSDTMRFPTSLSPPCARGLKHSGEYFDVHTVHFVQFIIHTNKCTTYIYI